MNHGTVLCYRKGKCRCEPCREAKRKDKAEYVRLRKAREDTGMPAVNGRPAIPLSERPHGSYVTYCKGCRCRPCTQANTDYGRERKAIRELREYERTGLLEGV